MKWLEENFAEFFIIYWIDTSKGDLIAGLDQGPEGTVTRGNNVNLFNFTPTIFSEDAMTVKFTV